MGFYRRWATVLLALSAMGAVAGPVSSASAAEFGIVPGSFAVTMLDADGNPESRAGSHPDRLQVDFELEVEDTGTSLKDLAIEMPPGFGGNPDAVQECPRQPHAEGEECPPESQVGVATFGESGGSATVLPIYQLEPEPGQFAAFASEVGVDLPFEMELRPNDYGITIKASELGESTLDKGQLELWGVPADHQVGTEIPRRPLLTTPSQCGPLTFLLRVMSRQEGAAWVSAAAPTDPLTGCADLSFDPQFGLGLSNSAADSPTNLRMDLDVPDEGGAEELASAQLKDVTVELPPGLTVSPSGAEAFTTCSDAQFGLGSTTDALCPPSSKLGTIDLSSAAVRDPLPGTIFLGEEQGGERFRTLVAVPGPGLVFKFVGALHPDPATGRLTATFHELPQVAIGRLSMHLDGGLLATPLACGPSAAVARFTPYGGGTTIGVVTLVSIVAGIPGLLCPGPIPFSPELVSRRSSQMAGRSTSFAATVRRRDGEQLPGRFSLALPAGLSAAFGAIGECPEANTASGACPPASRVGAARAQIGSGPRPATLQGDAYLAGPYRRAPFSILMSFRAAIGPFDLGSLVLRAAANIDRRGRVTVSTDRLPTTFEGIPIRFRTIEFDLDRPGLISNPTSCGPATVDASVEAQGGAAAVLASPFPVRGCGKLGFKPRITASFVGSRELREGGNPVLRFSAHLRRGDSNLRAMEFSLPSALEFDIAGLDEICSRHDAQIGLCPPGSRVGSAQGRTTLLGAPLKGGIFVVQPKGAGQPDLWVSLAAKGFELNVKGHSEARDGHFVTKLAGLPDIPLSAFVMRLGEGRQGILSLDASPCVDGHRRRLAARLSVKGQNGAQRRSRLPIGMKPRCGKSQQ